MNTNKTFNIAFIGGGINSAVGNTHKISAEMDGRFKVVAGCFSRHAEVNIATGKQWNINPDRVYASWQQMLEAELGVVDGIAVLTPTPSHYEIVTTCLDKGYHVICEKALANSKCEAELIKKKQKEKHAFLAVTYNYTGYPMIREMRAMIAKGVIGKVLQVHAEMPQEGFIKLDKNNQPIIPQAWRLQDGIVPTVSLDLGVHLHSLVYCLTQEKPVAVTGVQHSMGSFKQVVDNVLAIVEYTNQMICSMWFSKAASGYRNGLKIRVFGELGSLEWLQTDPEYVIHADNKGNRMILDRAVENGEVMKNLRYNRFKAGHPAGFIEAFANYYNDIADAMTSFNLGELSNNPYVFGADLAIEGLHLFEAISRSSKSKTWISL